MTNSEKILKLKRLFVTTRKLRDNTDQLIHQGKETEQDIEKVIDHINEMIALLPVCFPVGVKPEPAIIINLDDPEDEPTQITSARSLVLYEASLPALFEELKFSIWNYVAVVASEKSRRDKYKPLMLAQAKKYLALFPDYKNLQPDEMDQVMLCANQIGVYALIDEYEPVELEKILNYLEPVFALTTWLYSGGTKDTNIRLLMKLGRDEEAYDIIFEGFKDDIYLRDKTLEVIAEGQFTAFYNFINDNGLFRIKKKKSPRYFSDGLTQKGEAFVKLAAEPWFRSKASAKDPGNIELLEKYLKQVKAGK